MSCLFATRQYKYLVAYIVCFWFIVGHQKRGKLHLLLKLHAKIQVRCIYMYISKHHQVAFMYDVFWNTLIVGPWNLIELCMSKKENYYIIKLKKSKSKLLTHVCIQYNVAYTHEIRVHIQHRLSGAHVIFRCIVHSNCWISKAWVMHTGKIISSWRWNSAVMWLVHYL